MATIENEEKLRQLVLLKRDRADSLSISDEETLLDTAVIRFSIPLSRSKGILIAAAEKAGLEIESDVNRAIEAMVLSLAGRKVTLRQTDFELLVKYYARQMRLPPPQVRVRLKSIVERLGVQPGRAGLLYSTRWFRGIGSSSGVGEQAT